LPEGYRIGAGDVLQIAVWKEADASVPEVVVRADGKISVPLVKEVDVLGLTPKDLEKLLTEKLSRLINDPDVTVVAKQINSLKVYLAGAVRKEGPVPLLGPKTVLQAINEAGGLTEYAKKKKIYVLRPEGGKQVRLPFNYEDVIKGERPEQNILLKPNDMIVVPN
jgi:polysaccharide export outer membrane protein